MARKSPLSEKKWEALRKEFEAGKSGRSLAEKYKEAKAARLQVELREGETVVELELALQEMLFEENTEAYAEAHAKLQKGNSLKTNGELDLTLNDLLPKTPFENRRENWKPKPRGNPRKLRRP